MGLATIDPHSRKVQTKLYKIPKFSVHRANSKQETALWKCQNLQRNVWPSGPCPNTASGWPYISLLILTFLNHCISVKTSLINTKPGDFVSLGVFFLTIIYRLVLSPSRYEIRQCQESEPRVPPRLDAIPNRRVWEVNAIAAKKLIDVSVPDSPCGIASRDSFKGETALRVWTRTMKLHLT